MDSVNYTTVRKLNYCRVDAEIAGKVAEQISLPLKTQIGLSFTKIFLVKLRKKNSQKIISK